MSTAIPRITLFIFALAFCHNLFAATYGIGSSSQGSNTHRLALAFSTLLDRHESLNFRAEPRSGTSMAVPIVNSGELEFAIANPLELTFAYTGSGTFDNRPNPDLRLVSGLYPVLLGIMVRADSDVREISQLRGRRLSTGFRGQTILQYLTAAMLANGDLDIDDIRAVTSLNITESRRMFSSGRVDAFIEVIGSAAHLEIEAMSGPLRCLATDDTPDALERSRRHMPMFKTTMVEPLPRYSCVDEPTPMPVYNFFLYAHKDVPQDVVFRMVRALHRHHDELAEVIKPFNDFDPSMMHTDIGVPYHPGSLRYFREHGLD